MFYEVGPVQALSALTLRGCRVPGAAAILTSAIDNQMCQGSNDKYLDPTEGRR